MHGRRRMTRERNTTGGKKKKETTEGYTEAEVMTVAEADRGIPDVLPMPSLCARIRTNTHSPYSSPVPPVSAPYPFSNPPDKEDGECRRKTGIQREYGHRNHDAGDELHNSAKPLRKPPVPAHPPIKETCAFSQYGSILRTKKEPLQQQLSFPSNINFLNYRSSKSSPASYPSVSRSSVPASWSATSGAAASCSSSRPSRRSPDTIS